MDHSGAVVLERPRSFTRRLVRHDSFSCLPDAQLAPRFPRFLVAGSIQNRSVLAEPSRQYHEAAPRLVRQPQVLPKVVSQLFQLGAKLYFWVKPNDPGILLDRIWSDKLPGSTNFTGM